MSVRVHGIPTAAELLGARQTEGKTAPPAAKSVFDSVMRQVQETQSKQSAVPVPYIVKKGDTLSGICEAQLKKLGKPAALTDVYAAVRSVAAGNGLASPDRIGIDQRLDLAVLSGGKPAPLAATTAAKALPVGGRPSLLPKPSLSNLREMLPVSERSVLGGSLPALQKAAQPILASSPDITSEYGFRRNPFTRKLEYHGGIDLAASPGTAIYPALPGTVKFSGWQSGYGNVVIVDHGNGLETLYGHNSSNKVQAGQTVKSNTQIGKVGSTGDSTGPHVHFEVHIAGKPVNPTTLVSRQSLQVAKAL